MGIKAYVEILRPVNCVIGSLTILIGMLNGFTGSSFIDFFSKISNIIVLIGGFIIYIIVAGASNLINDYFDYEIDKINRPNRPIPRGEISRKQVIYYFTLLSIISLLLSIITGLFTPNPILIPSLVAFFLFIAYIYAWKAKASGFPGNILVGISFSFGIPFGALFISLIGNVPYKIWFFFLTSMFLLISREIIKGSEDVEGDRNFNIKTIANTKGYKTAAIISVIFMSASVLTFTLPAFILNMNLGFIIIMIFGDLTVILSIISLRDYSKRKNQKNSSLYLKIGAFLGLIAYIVASIY